MATEIMGSSTWVKLAMDGHWPPVGGVVGNPAGEGPPPGFTELSGVRADGRVVRLADWPDFAAYLRTFGWPFGGDDRAWWERLLGRPQRTAAVPDFRGRIVLD